MSLVIDRKSVTIKSISEYVNNSFDPMMVYGQLLQIRLFMDNGYEWYILDFDEESCIAIGLINQADPVNASIGQIKIRLLDNLPNVKVDAHYVPENINQIYNRLTISSKIR